MLNRLLLPARFVAAFVALGLSQIVREPGFAADRPMPLIGAIALAGAVLLSLGLDPGVPRGSGDHTVRRRSRMAASLMAVLALASALFSEGRFQWDRARVLMADPEQVAALGQHVVVGYRDQAEAIGFVEQGIGGLFVTRRNVDSKTRTQIAEEIAALQAIRKRQGRPPLIIATDQEGGLVSRMSPPLERPPSLREVAQAVPSWAKATDHGRAQGRELAGLGITLNFAPVVDLDFGIADPGDRYSRISERAIGREPERVTAIAGAYCAGLVEAGVMCTLKHFPGLGRVQGDSHVGAVTLEAPVSALEKEDWQPFRALAGRPGVVTMVGHVRLTATADAQPASVSPDAIGILRGWSPDGLVVTDDLCMQAIHGSQLGIGGSAVAALNAGVDLLLISWDSERYYTAMAALLTASRAGTLDPEKLAASQRRLSSRSSRPPV